MKKLLIFALLILFATCLKQRYDSYSLCKVRIPTKKYLDVFSALFSNEPLDVWSYDGNLVVGMDMDILFSPKQLEKLMENKFLLSDFSIIHKDIQVLIDAEEKEIKKRSEVINDLLMLFKTQEDKNKFRFAKDNYFNNYHPLSEIDEFVKHYQQNYPTMAEYFTIGKSHEGRPLFGLKLHSPGPHNATKPTFYIIANAHAREWISTMTSQYIMANILDGYEKTPEVKHILDRLNVYILFMFNPDGYDYSYTKTRLWRKNRNPNSGKYYGVDLNRNFGAGYGIGASSSESSETYKGKFAYSEPEVKAVDEFFKNNRQIVAGLDLHSYSQLLLRPFSYKSAASPHEEQMRKMGAEMQEAIKSVHKETYQNIRGIQLYAAGGVLDDDIHEKYGVKSYVIELRDKGRYGFVLPPQYIIPTGEEIFKAFLVLAKNFAK